MLRLLPSLLRSFRRDDHGGTAIEFAFVAPVLFFAILALIEVGVMVMTSTQLELAVVDASRRIRTGRDDAAANAPDFEGQICAQMGGSQTKCRERLTVSVQRFSGFSAANAVIAAAPDGSFNKGAAGDIVVVKANYVWPIMNPFVGESAGRTGPTEVTLTSRDAFKNEPFS